MTRLQPPPEIHLPVPLIHLGTEDRDDLASLARGIAALNPDDCLTLMEKLALMGVKANIYRE